MKIFLSTLFIVLFFNSTGKTQPFGEPTCDLILKAQFKKAKVKICNKTLDVEIADNEVLTSFGLMCRDTLPENSGMIFVFKEERTLSFWMKNTKIPLSIGYFDKNKQLINTYDMEPMNEAKVYPSHKPALYAIEANQGWYSKNKIASNCKFEFVEEPSAHKKSVTKGQ